MADMTTIKERIAETIYPNGTGAITAEAHQALLLEMVDDINAKKQDAEEGKGLVSDAERMAWNNKADKAERYPDMSVGFADDLVGRGESTPAEFSFRASGGKSIKDGAARIKRLRGNSVVWNQKVEKTYVDQDRVLYNIDVISQNHKFALIRSKAFGGCYYMPSGDVYDYFLTDGEYAKIFVQSHVVDAEYSRIYSSGESGYVQLIDLTLMFRAGNEPTTIEEYYARKPIVEDEFAYNEGEVIHMTAEGIKSVGDNAWDEEWRLGYYSMGGYVPVNTQICNKNPIRVLPNTEYNITGMASDGAYIWFLDKDMNFLGYTLCYISVGSFTTPSNAAYIHFNFEPGYGVEYKNDIMITLVHSGWKQDTDAGYQPYWEDKLMFDERIKEHFPDGMKNWDMVFNRNGKGYVVKGTGVVDLGSLSWYDDTFNGVPTFTTKDVTNGVMRSMYDSLGGSILSLYSEMIEFGHLATSDNKVFVFNSLAHSPNTLAVRDTAYTDASEFKSAMNGVMFYYQLAEPTIIEYDEPFNLDYKVADFGTEQMLTEQPSAPIAADIIYQFNAVDMIRELWLKVQELEARLNG